MPESRGFDSSLLGAGTGSGEDALGRLVGDVDRFARECWERKPLLRPRAERDDSQDERFNDPFSLADLDHVISAGWLRYPGFAFRRSEEGAPNARRFDTETCTTTRMVGPRLVDDAADPGRIRSTLNKGLTLQLYQPAGDLALEPRPSPADQADQHEVGEIEAVVLETDRLALQNRLKYHLTSPPCQRTGCTAVTR